MKWKIREEIAPVGSSITYSGHPSWHNLLSFRGQVAGYELIPDKGQQIILQTYGYFGSSGSGVYDTDGYLVGILWGIDLEYCLGFTYTKFKHEIGPRSLMSWYWR